MLRSLFFIMLTALPAHAAELWCMPDTSCRGETCRATDDEESSIRLHDPDGRSPVLRAMAEDVPMTKTHDGAVVQWEGKGEWDRTLVLAMRLDDMAYVFSIRSSDGEIGKYSGRCENQ